LSCWRKKIIVWGKFDEIHNGHLEFLKNARKLGDELYIVIIPDKKVKENSGNLPVKTAKLRKKMLVELNFVTDVYIDCLSDGLKSVLKLNPDVFVFGHDQKTKWEKQLKEYFSFVGLDLDYVYLGVYNKGIHSSSIVD